MAQGRGSRRTSRLVVVTLVALVTGLFPAAPSHADPGAESQAVRLPVHKVPALSRPGLANRLKGLPKMMPAPKGQAAPRSGGTRLMPMQAGLNAAKPASYPMMDRVSLSAGGEEFDKPSEAAPGQAISGDGRFVVFATAATAATGSVGDVPQILVRDRQTGALELISRGYDGDLANAGSDSAVISSDGRYVAFLSLADNLVPGDQNYDTDAFVYDRTTKKLERVSVASDGTEADGSSYSVSISDDGRYVAFSSEATNLADVAALYNIFVHDRQTHQTELISQRAAGIPADGPSFAPSISGNGRYLAFLTAAGNLTAEGAGGVVRFDRTTGKTELASLNEAGLPFNRSDTPSISGDGSKVVFVSTDPEVGNHIFVRDMNAKLTTMADTSAAGDAAESASQPAISRDGSTVAFVALGQGLTPNPTPAGSSQLYVKTLKTGAIRLASSDRLGVAAENMSWAPSLTSDGRYAAFTSDDPNLVSGDTNDLPDVFVSGPDVTAPGLGLTRAGTPAVYLYAYHEATDEFELAGIGVQSGKSVTLAVGPGFAADGWALEVYLSEVTGAATLNKKGVDLADDGFSFALEIGAPGSKAASYTLEMTDLTGNKASQTIQVQSYTKAPAMTVTSPTENPLTVGANGKVTFTGKADQPLLEVCLFQWPSFELYDCTSTNAGNTFTLNANVPEDGDYAVYGWNGALFYDEGESWMLAGLSSFKSIGFDTVAPTVPEITSPALVDGVLYARSNNVTVSGTTEPLATVTGTLAAGDKTMTVQADRNGKFSLSYKGVSQGETMLTLTTTDRFGNADAPAELPLVVDLAAPVPGLISFLDEYDAVTDAQPDGAGKYSITIPEKVSGYLLLEFNEGLATVKVNKSTAQNNGESSFAVPVLPSLASNSYPIEVTDLAGNVTKLTVTIKIDNTAPKLTVSAPGATAYAGPLSGGDLGVVLAGTANEPLAEVAVFEDLGPGQEPLQVDAAVTLDGTRWSARVAFSAVESSTHKLYVLGRDLAGNWSVRDPRGADIRTVTVDPNPPAIDFDTTLLGFYDGDDTVRFLYMPTSVTVKGKLSDFESGPAKMMIGSTTLTPKNPVDNFAFYQSISLTEGFTDLTIVGTDRAGNTSQAYRLRALVKTRVSTLTAKASFSTGKQFLTVSGTTDRAYLVDDQYIGVVPVTITVTKKSGEQVDSVTLDASTADSSLYNLSKGSFKYAFDMSGWTSGKYLVTITADKPVEFPFARTKSTTITVTRP